MADIDETPGGLRLGRRIAPPRFLGFLGVFAIVAVALPGPLDFGRATMIAFDIAAGLFLLSLLPLLRVDDRDRMRARAKANDANRGVLLLLTVLVTGVILVSVARELTSKGSHLAAALIVGTLAIAWLFTNTIYALHYAHLFYGDTDGSGADDGGLEFPHTEEPDYWDFVYYSFTLGMTFQTSDVTTTSGTMRRVSLGQCMAAFVFNLGVLAFSINVLGGGS